MNRNTIPAMTGSTGERVRDGNPWTTSMRNRPTLADALQEEDEAAMLHAGINGGFDARLDHVSAVEGVFIGASNELGAFESGVAARMFGVPWAIAGGGLITMGIAVSFAFVFPSIRRIDTFDELRPKSPAVVT